MASFTTSQAGNWSNPATWGGSGPPGSGDRVVIHHDVTITADTIVGEGLNTASGVYAIEFGAGNLTLNAGVKLTVRGDWTSGGSSKNFTAGAGSHLEFDVPAGQKYILKHWGILTFNGTESDRCTISAKVGGGILTVEPFNSVPFQFIASYTDFLRLGSNSEYSLWFGAGGQVVTVDITHGEFDSCGLVYMYNEIGSSTMRIDDTRFRNTVSSSPVMLASTEPITTGTRSFQRNRLDKVISMLGGVKDYTLDGTYFFASTGFVGAYAWASAKNVFIAKQGPDVGVCGSLEDSYILFPALDQQHAINNNAGLAITELKFDGNIFDHHQFDDPQGDPLFIRPTAATCNVSVRRNILLPNAAGRSPGYIVGSVGDNDKTLISVEHNTACTRDGMGIYTGHLQTVEETPKRWSSFKSNLMFSGVAGSGYKASTDLGITFVDLIPPAVIGYNAGFNLDDAVGDFTNSGNSYRMAFSVTPGSTDLDGEDPEFFDPTRNFLTWGQSINPALATVQEILDEMMLGTAGFTTEALVNYVREGFRPTNPAYEASAHDGTTIGAVAYGEVLEVPGYGPSTVPGWLTFTDWIKTRFEFEYDNYGITNVDSLGFHNHDLLNTLVHAIGWHPGNAKIQALRDEARVVWNNYVVGSGGGMAEAFILYEGMFHDAYRTNNADSVEAVNVVTSSGWLMTPGGAYPEINSHQNASRGVAYMLMGHTLADKYGYMPFSANPTRIPFLLDWALNHIKEWTGDPTPWIEYGENAPGTQNFTQSFMMGLTGQALAMYDDWLHESTGNRDPRIVPALAQLAFRLRSRHWRQVPGDFIWIHGVDNSDGNRYYVPPLDNTNPGDSAMLFNVEAVAFMWYVWKATGCQLFKDWEDESFEVASGFLPGLGLDLKQFNEYVRFAWQGLLWRDATPVDTVTDFYLADAPVWPEAVTGEPLSAAIRIMQLSAVTASVTLDDGADGVFSPNPVVWDNESGVKDVQYTPASSGVKSITLTNNAGLTDPEPVYFMALGEAPAPDVVESYTWTGSSSGNVNQPSTFTVTLGPGSLEGSIRFTPNASAGSGTWLPAFRDLTGLNRSETFTYTPTSLEERNLSVTNNGGLTEASGITFTPTPGGGEPVYQEFTVGKDISFVFSGPGDRKLIIPWDGRK